MTPPPKDPGDEPFLKVLRPLVEAFYAFLEKDDRHVRALGLTLSQFDVIATLGDTEGMTCKQLSDETLVTKGTLTGVLDRLEAKGLVERVPSQADRRATIIRLTSKGEKKFQEVFPKHIYYMKPFFEQALTGAEMKTLRELLLRLKESFEQKNKN
ncbi:MAG: MarR family transcriptional regulator [Candidatus Manganitrophaceae bacterium]|nr:MAG: MarR family transcriptional regulator [Candidatus Manganitrophaceae bacterium]